MSIDTIAGGLDVEAAPGAPVRPGTRRGGRGAGAEPTVLSHAAAPRIAGTGQCADRAGASSSSRRRRSAACERALGNLTVIGNKAQCMADDDRGSPLAPGRSAIGEDAARILNHDLRSLLTVILGYGDDLRRVAGKYFLDDFVPEFDQLRGLGHRILSLVDSTVTQLRSSDCDSLVDDLQRYLERGAAPAGRSDEEVRPAAEPGRIVVAEDDERIRELLCDYLRSQGHEVVAARDGARGARAHPLRPLRPPPDRYRDAEGQRLPVARPDRGRSPAQRLPRDRHLRSRRAGRDRPLHHDGRRGLPPQALQPRDPQVPGSTPRLEKKRLRDRTEQQRRRYNELLLSILPASIVAELSQTNAVRPRRCEDVAVLFADIVGFTQYCDRRQDQPELVVQLPASDVRSLGGDGLRPRRPEDQDDRRRVHGGLRAPGGCREPRPRLRAARHEDDRVHPGHVR